MSNIKVKGFSATTTTPCIVQVDDGNAEFSLQWKRPKLGGEKEKLIKELTRGERKMFRQQAEASSMIKEHGDDIPQEFFDVLDQTEDLAEQHTKQVLTSLKKHLTGWQDLTGEDEDGQSCDVPFDKKLLEELLTDPDWQKGFIDAYRGLLGLRQQEREEKAKN